MKRQINRNWEKLKELLLYIALKSEHDPHFGATKLNKVLFYVDFAAFARWGEPITGETYQRLDFGPAPRALLPAQTELTEAGRCAMQELDRFGRKQKRLLALREPDLTAFSGREIALVDDIIEELWDKNASEVSELSHLNLGWQLAQPNEDIPYETVHVSQPRQLSRSEIEYGQELFAAG